MPITESKNADAVTLGLGVLGLAVLPAASPLTYTDVGYIKACTVSYSRELKDYESAGLLVKRLAFRDRFRINADFSEVSLSNLQKIIPSQLTGSTLKFGGSRTITRYSVRFEHTRDDAQVITIDIYRAVASGEFALAFAEEEYIRYPVEYSAEADSTKATGQQYGSIRIA